MGSRAAVDEKLKIDDKLASQIHGIISSDSDSDFGRDFDEDYNALKPPPLDYESIRHMIVKISRPNVVNVWEERSKNVQIRNEEVMQAGVTVVSKKKKRKTKSKQTNQVISSGSVIIDNENLEPRPTEVKKNDGKEQFGNKPESRVPLGSKISSNVTQPVEIGSLVQSEKQTANTQNQMVVGLPVASVNSKFKPLDISFLNKDYVDNIEKNPNIKVSEEKHLETGAALFSGRYVKNETKMKKKKFLPLDMNFIHKVYPKSVGKIPDIEKKCTGAWTLLENEFPDLNDKCAINRRISATSIDTDTEKTYVPSYIDLFNDGYVKNVEETVDTNEPEEKIIETMDTNFSIWDYEEAVEGSPDDIEPTEVKRIGQWKTLKERHPKLEKCACNESSVNYDLNTSTYEPLAFKFLNELNVENFWVSTESDQSDEFVHGNFTVNEIRSSMPNYRIHIKDITGDLSENTDEHDRRISATSIDTDTEKTYVPSYIDLFNDGYVKNVEETVDTNEPEEKIIETMDTNFSIWDYEEAVEGSPDDIEPTDVKGIGQWETLKERHPKLEKCASNESSVNYDLNTSTYEPLAFNFLNELNVENFWVSTESDQSDEFVHGNFTVNEIRSSMPNYRIHIKDITGDLSENTDEDDRKIWEEVETAKRVDILTDNQDNTDSIFLNKNVSMATDYIPELNPVDVMEADITPTTSKKTRRRKKKETKMTKKKFVPIDMNFINEVYSENTGKNLDIEASEKNSTLTWTLLENEFPDLNEKCAMNKRISATSVDNDKPTDMEEKYAPSDIDFLNDGYVKNVDKRVDTNEPDEKIIEAKDTNFSLWDCEAAVVESPDIEPTEVKRIGLSETLKEKYPSVNYDLSTKIYELLSFNFLNESWDNPVSDEPYEFLLKSTMSNHETNLGKNNKKFQPLDALKVTQTKGTQTDEVLDQSTLEFVGINESTSSPIKQTKKKLKKKSKQSVAKSLSGNAVDASDSVRGITGDILQNADKDHTKMLEEVHEVKSVEILADNQENSNSIVLHKTVEDTFENKIQSSVNFPMATENIPELNPVDVMEAAIPSTANKKTRRRKKKESKKQVTEPISQHLSNESFDIENKSNVDEHDVKEDEKKIFSNFSNDEYMSLVTDDIANLKVNHEKPQCALENVMQTDSVGPITEKTKTKKKRRKKKKQSTTDLDAVDLDLAVTTEKKFKDGIEGEGRYEQNPIYVHEEYRIINGILKSTMAISNVYDRMTIKFEHSFNGVLGAAIQNIDRLSISSNPNWQDLHQNFLCEMYNKGLDLEHTKEADMLQSTNTKPKAKRKRKKKSKHSPSIEPHDETEKNIPINEKISEGILKEPKETTVLNECNSKIVKVSDLHGNMSLLANLKMTYGVRSKGGVALKNPKYIFSTELKNCIHPIDQTNTDIIKNLNAHMPYEQLYRAYIACIQKINEIQKVLANQLSVTTIQNKIYTVWQFEASADKIIVTCWEFTDKICFHISSSNPKLNLAFWAMKNRHYTPCLVDCTTETRNLATVSNVAISSNFGGSCRYRGLRNIGSDTFKILKRICECFKACKNCQVKEIFFNEFFIQENFNANYCVDDILQIRNFLLSINPLKFPVRNSQMALRQYLKRSSKNSKLDFQLLTKPDNSNGNPTIALKNFSGTLHHLEATKEEMRHIYWKFGSPTTSLTDNTVNIIADKRNKSKSVTRNCASATATIFKGNNIVTLATRKLYDKEFPSLDIYRSSYEHDQKMNKTLVPAYSRDTNKRKKNKFVPLSEYSTDKSKDTLTKTNSHISNVENRVNRIFRKAIMGSSDTKIQSSNFSTVPKTIRKHNIADTKGTSVAFKPKEETVNIEKRRKDSTEKLSSSASLDKPYQNGIEKNDRFMMRVRKQSKHNFDEQRITQEKFQKTSKPKKIGSEENIGLVATPSENLVSSKNANKSFEDFVKFFNESATILEDCKRTSKIIQEEYKENVTQKDFEELLKKFCDVNNRALTIVTNCEQTCRLITERVKDIDNVCNKADKPVISKHSPKKRRIERKVRLCYRLAGSNGPVKSYTNVPPEENDLSASSDRLYSRDCGSDKRNVATYTGQNTGDAAPSNVTHNKTETNAAQICPVVPRHRNIKSSLELAQRREHLSTGSVKKKMLSFKPLATFSKTTDITKHFSEKNSNIAKLERFYADGGFDGPFQRMVARKRRGNLGRAKTDMTTHFFILVLITFIVIIEIAVLSNFRNLSLFENISIIFFISLLYIYKNKQRLLPDF